MTVDPDDPRLHMRPFLGLLLLVLALTAIAGTFVAYGVLVWSGFAGRPAAGARVALAFRGCPEAVAPIQGRLADMGLDATVTRGGEGFTVTTVLPSDPTVAAAIPTTLARPGVLEVRAGEAVLATSADVLSAEPRLDLRMASYVVVRVGAEAEKRVTSAVRADPSGHLTLRIDGVDVAVQPNGTPIARGELEFAPQTDDDAVRMRTIAEWAVVLDHGPLPCLVAAL